MQKQNMRTENVESFQCVSVSYREMKQKKKENLIVQVVGVFFLQFHNILFILE